MKTAKAYRAEIVSKEKLERGERIFRNYARRVMAIRAAALLAEIHSDIAPKIDAMRALDAVGEEKNEIEIVAPSVRKGWTWGKVGKTIKGNIPREYSLGTIEESLIAENSIGHRLIAA